jgi:SAM-dependent methyltransferase
MGDRLEKARAALACPACSGALDFGAEGARCAVCDASYPIRRGKLYFTHPPGTQDDLDSLKHRLKGLLGKLYYSVGVTLLAPTYPFRYRAAIERHCDPGKALCVDIGCGNHRVSDDLVCVDIFDYDAVDIVCDLSALPFKADSVDAFVSRSVLEHLPRVSAVVSQLKRCTRPGGVSMHLIPFLFPYHASPGDYQRYTHSGAANLFGGWELLEQRSATGPMTLLLLWFIEFFSTVLGAGNQRARSYVYLALCVVLWPLKFLDLPFVGRSSFLGMAPTIWTVMRKP